MNKEEYMSAPNYKRTRLACFTSYLTMASVFCVPPILFVTLREMYGVSYTLLGTLVLINFITQLSIDLIFTFFAKHFNPKVMVRVMPLVTSLGLFIYAFIPSVAPDLAYLGLVIGTVVFSVAAGLSEVLLSPTIAALPSDNPQRDMSFLHSLYAFGVLFAVVFSTLFLKIFGNENWAYLMYVLALFPMISAVLFMLSPMPDMTGEDSKTTLVGSKERTVALALCVGCIFTGSCAENTMSNWLSGFMENALGIDKTLGDILGVAVFAVLLGLARIAYARFGKKITPVLFVGMAMCAVCYLVVGFTSNAIVSFIACILVGFFSSMLWPGTLILMEENIKNPGVTAFALLAAGGDLGASVAPQLMGIVIDTVSASDLAATLAPSLGITAEQLGMRAGMLTTAIFPLLGILILSLTARFFKKHKNGI